LHDGTTPWQALASPAFAPVSLSLSLSLSLSQIISRALTRQVPRLAIKGILASQAIEFLLRLFLALVRRVCATSQHAGLGSCGGTADKLGLEIAALKPRAELEMFSAPPERSCMSSDMTDFAPWESMVDSAEAIGC